MAQRDYKKEYSKFQSTTEQKKKRAERNKIRRKALINGTVQKGDDYDMSHTKNGILKKHKSKNRGSKKDMKGDIKARGKGQKKNQPSKK
jgi:hypothetical protein